jgi:HK97 family phage major capsid protein
MGHVAFNSIISRANAQAQIPEVVSNRIQGLVAEKSVALSLFPQVRMATNETRMPVLSALPTAAFVNPTDTGLKQTTQVTWANKYLDVEEIATIVPIPESVLADLSFDTWGAIEPLVAEAIGRVVDAAVFFGTNKPSTWGPDLTSGAASGTVVNNVTLGAASAANGGVATDISNAMSKVEIDGFDPSDLVVDRLFRSKLRNLRDTTGQRLLDVGADGESFDGLPIHYGMRGLWPAATTGNVAGFVVDRSQGIIGIRQDITTKIFTEGVVTDASGVVQYNLMQQDMVAMRVVARFAWQVANTINRSELVAANRFPAATLLYA